MMRKTAVALCVVLVFMLLAGCGGQSAGEGSPNDYRTVIEESRDPELNDLPLFSIVTGEDDDKYDMFFDPAFGFNPDDMQRYAISLGTIITQAYGVAIILPAEGKEQAVLDQVNAYVEQQKKAQENYLPDQYEIASSAIVKTAPTGEVLLAMCEGAADVMTNMEAGLKA